MATVPVITNRSVLPKQMPLSPLSASGTDGAFGQQEAQAITSLGQNIAEAGGDISKAKDIIDAQDNKREFDSLDSQYTAFLRTMTYGDGTADNPGYLAQKGENAINSYATTQQAIKDYRSKLLGSASNNDVKNMFAIAAQHRTDQTFSLYLSHLSQERMNANNALTDERVKQAQQDSRTGWADTSIIDRGNSIIQGDLQIAGRRNGEDPEVTAGKIKDTISGNVLGAVTSAAAVDTTKAKALLAQYGKQLNGADMTKALTVIHSFETQKTVDSLRQIELQKAQLGQIQEQEASDFASRLYDPQHPLTVPDIMASHLTGPMKLSLTKAVEAVPAKTDVLLYNGMFDEVAAGKFTPQDFVGNVLPFVGHGLSGDDYNRLLAMAQSYQKIGGTALQNIITGYKPYITNSTLLGKPDVQGDGNYMLFKNDMLQLVQDTFKAGGAGAVNDLLNPNSKAYQEKVIPIVMKYRRTPNEDMAIQQQRMQGLGLPAGTKIPPRPTGVPPNAAYSPTNKQYEWLDPITHKITVQKVN